MPRKTTEKKSKLAGFASVVSQLKGGWAPPATVLKRVRAVPTIFPQLNIASGVGGWPVERICCIRGPSNHGKTILAHGLGLSFLQLGHMYAFIDAELTTPITWIESLMNEHADNPAFIAQRPDSYEQTVDDVRELSNAVIKARASEFIDADYTGLIVVDSLQKLNPQRLLDRLLKDGADSEKGSIDGMGGRAAQWKAQLNSQWLNEICPLMATSGLGMTFVVRENEATTPNGMPTTKQTGGKAVEFDSSLIARVQREEWVTHGKNIVGERHRITIKKTKVGPKQDRETVCYFHTSNGGLIPPGFDTARDWLEIALMCGAVQKESAKAIWMEQVDTGERWQGTNQAVKALQDKGSMQALIDSVQKKQRESEDAGV